MLTSYVIPFYVIAFVWVSRGSVCLPLWRGQRKEEMQLRKERAEDLA